MKSLEYVIHYTNWKNLGQIHLDRIKISIQYRYLHTWASCGNIFNNKVITSYRFPETDEGMKTMQ